MRSFFAGGDDSLENDVAPVINAASHLQTDLCKAADRYTLDSRRKRSAIPFGNFGHALLPLNKVL